MSGGAADCVSLAIAFHQAPGRFSDLLHGRAEILQFLIGIRYRGNKRGNAFRTGRIGRGQGGPRPAHEALAPRAEGCCDGVVGERPAYASRDAGQQA